MSRNVYTADIFEPPRLSSSSAFVRFSGCTTPGSHVQGRGHVISLGRRSLFTKFSSRLELGGILQLVLRQLLPLVLLATAGLSGCTRMGPKTIAGARFDYNEAIIQSFDSQMLLNLVRLRYQDSILFLDLSSVVASYRLDLSAGVSPSGTVDPKTYAWGASGGVGWGETPTISYQPLQGEDFAKRLLAPIDPSAILLLSRSGWGLERLLLCTVQQMNELPNGTAIGGVAPVQVLHFEKFRRVATIMRTLQESGYIQLNTLAEPLGTVAVTAGPIPMTEQARALAQEAIGLLQLSRTEGQGPISVDAPTFPRSPAELVLSGRSFLGVMTFLAQHVDVPKEHVSQGLVRITKGADGKPFNWKQISNNLFRVRSGRWAPKQAYLKVKYRDHWFWIDDTDIESKGTYTLLAQLFSLQAATSRIAAPVLTIPTR